MISKELDSADSRFARICSTALRSVICSSRPKRVAPISPDLLEKVQPASWIFRPNPYPSRFLTNLQPGAQGSLSNRRSSGKSVPSLIRMVPIFMVSGIWALLGVYSGTLFGSSWRLRLDVSVDSDFVTGGPSSRLPHVIFRCRDTDPFVSLRLPQSSNKFTSHVERGPGLAFGSHGFRQTSAFLDQPGSRIDCVWH
jgi:hypothetical protein